MCLCFHFQENNWPVQSFWLSPLETLTFVTLFIPVITTQVI